MACDHTHISTCEYHFNFKRPLPTSGGYPHTCQSIYLPPQVSGNDMQSSGEESCEELEEDDDDDMMEGDGDSDEFDDPGMFEGDDDQLEGDTM